MQESKLLLVSLNPLTLLRLPAPIAFPLRLYHGSTVHVRTSCVRTIMAYVPVESRTVYLVLLKSDNALVKLLPTFGIRSFVERFRIGEIGSVKQKVGGFVNQKLLRRNRLFASSSFTHDSQASTPHNRMSSPFIATAHLQKAHCKITGRRLLSHLLDKSCCTN